MKYWVRHVYTSLPHSQWLCAFVLALLIYSEIIVGIASHKMLLFASHARFRWLQTASINEFVFSISNFFTPLSTFLH